MSNPVTAPLSPEPTAPRAPLVSRTSYGLRRHAPLFVSDRFDSGVSRTPSSECSRLSVDDRPYAHLEPEVYSRSADLLSSLDKQPTGRAAQRRAAAYAAMSMAEVEQAVRRALQDSPLSWGHISRSVSSFFRGLATGDESVIAIRELCRRGGDPAAFGARDI